MNGKKITSKHIISLYDKTRSAAVPGLTILPKLRHEHVYLTNFSKMRVDLAAQVSTCVGNLSIKLLMRQWMSYDI